MRVSTNQIEIFDTYAHEYPDDPELRGSSVDRFLEDIADLSELYKFVRTYIADYFPNKVCMYE